MAWVKLYERIGWENVPSTKSPINDLNLNKIDIAVDGLDDRVIELQTTKAEQTDLLASVKDVDINQTTGVITITFNNNTTKTFDTVLEKVVTNFTYDAATQSLILTLADGTTQSIPLSEFITQNEFLNSDRITFSVSEGKVRADLIKGSITGDYLQPNYLADITAQASLAGASATAAATSEANAAQSAETASTKATEAGQSATTASTKADEASASATTASTKASEATTAAQTATTKASEASTSAQTATTKATEAATSATNAATSETNAQNSATAANTKATEASASADRAEQAAQSTEGTVKWSERKGYVGKNLLENTAISHNVGGLTITVNADKSVTVSGTSTQRVNVQLMTLAEIKYVFLPLIGEKLKVSGCPSGGSLTSYWFSVQGLGQDGIGANDTGSGAEVTVSDFSQFQVVQIYLSILSGVTMDDITFYPMIRYADIEDSTYEPYLPKNDELAKNDVVENVVSRNGYNLFSLETNSLSYTAKGLTGVVDKAAGTVTVSGTLNEQSIYQYILRRTTVEAAGLEIGKKYRLYDGNGGNNYDGAYVILWLWDENNTHIRNIRTSTTDRTPFMLEAEVREISFVVEVASSKYGKQIDNTIYPMIYPDEYGMDVPFQPYAMTNRELTKKVEKFEAISVYRAENSIGTADVIAGVLVGSELAANSPTTRTAFITRCGLVAFVDVDIVVTTQTQIAAFDGTSILYGLENILDDSGSVYYRSNAIGCVGTELKPFTVLKTGNVLSIVSRTALSIPANTRLTITLTSVAKRQP